MGVRFGRGFFGERRVAVRARFKLLPKEDEEVICISCRGRRCLLLAIAFQYTTAHF